MRRARTCPSWLSTAGSRLVQSLKILPDTLAQRNLTGDMTSQIAPSLPATEMPIRLTSWWRARIIPIVILSLTVPILTAASLLEPSASGLGTHKSLGLPPCGVLVAIGLPCVTCGYTTAFAHAAHGNLLQAFAAQPAGATLAVVTAAITIAAAYALITGACLKPLVRRILKPKLLWITSGVVLSGWAYKIIVLVEVL